MTLFKNSSIEYIKKMLESHGSIRIKSMFGGCGMCTDNRIMAIITDNELYFKSSKESAKYFKSCESTLFQYSKGGKKISMLYWKVLPEIIEKEDLLKRWIDMVLGACYKVKNSILSVVK